MGVEYTDKSKPWIAKLDQVVDQSVGAAGEFLAQTVQDQMPGGGASVKDGTGGDTGVRGEYTASSAGNPPGVRTNRLKSSITSQKTGKKKERSVGTNVEYARIHEFGGTINHPGGTRFFIKDGKFIPVSEKKALELALQGKRLPVTKPHTITIPARPFMAPGLDAAKKPMLRVFLNTLRRGMKQ